MSTTIGCPIPGTSQQKEPVRLIDANDVMQNVLDEIRYKESLYTLTVRRIAQRAIDAAPTIDPESLRPTAHWDIGATDPRDVILYWKCSKCGRLTGNDYPYCPHCGKRMVNEND